MPQSLHNTLSTLKNNNLNVENIYSIPHSRSNNFLRAISGSQSTPRKSTAKLINEEGIEEAIICSLENFEIKNPIGYGSSSVVYNAVYKPKNTRVALKMIDFELFERNQIDEVRRETALMALCKHPNILKVYGSFMSGSKLYIATPYLSGGSCLDMMKSGFEDGFEEITIATILKQALEGIIYLHKNGHIHRDVKAD